MESEVQSTCIDDSVNACIARGVTRKLIYVVAIVDGVYWIIEVLNFGS